MTALRQTWQVTLRGTRVLVRQPAYLGITLTQPVIWLLLFGALFKAVTQIPGFDGGSYVDFLTPGIVMMLAVSSAGWTGMTFIDDISGGVIQTTLIVLLALVLGANYTGGIGGVLILLALACATFATRAFTRYQRSL